LPTVAVKHRDTTPLAALAATLLDRAARLR
jgi:hypothetical protein